MQARTVESLEEVLVLVENSLPLIRIATAKIKEVTTAMLTGTVSADDIKEEKSTDLYSNLEKLKLFYQEIPKDKLGENLNARCLNAIDAGGHAIKNMQELIAKLHSAAFQLLSGGPMLFQTRRTPATTQTSTQPSNQGVSRLGWGQ